MLRIGKNASSTVAVNPLKAQVNLGDLYQLFTQGSASRGSEVQLLWRTNVGDYTLVLKVDARGAALWQLVIKRKFDRSCLWSLATSDMAEVHRRLLLSCHAMDRFSAGLSA